MAIYRCRVRGHSAVILDWSVSFSISAATGLAAVIADAVADGVTDLWNGVPAGTDAVKTLYDVATVVDDALVDELDNTMVHNVSQGLAPLTLAGTGSGEPLPPQTCIVASLLTILPTRAGRGRMYWPATTLDTVDGGRVLTASRDILANGVQNMFDSIQAAAGGAYNVVIRHPSFIPSTFTDVTSIRVGDVFDTQRRRRNKLKENNIQLALS
jgi:hypothetical protein